MPKFKKKSKKFEEKTYDEGYDEIPGNHSEHFQKKIQTFFSDKYSKTAILVTLAFLVATTLVTIYYNPYLHSNDSIFYFWAGKQILAGQGSNVVLPNAPIGGPILFALTDDPFTHMRIISISWPRSASSTGRSPVSPKPRRPFT